MNARAWPCLAVVLLALAVSMAPGPGAPAAQTPEPAPAAEIDPRAVEQLKRMRPAGCASVPVAGGVYDNCGGVFYQPHYQSANLVYVVVPAP